MQPTYQTQEERAALLSEAGFITTEAESDSWPHTNGKNRPINHWQNTEWLCGRMGTNFRYNEMTKRTESSLEEYRNLSQDSIITDLRGRCAEHGYTLGKNEMADHISRIAEKNKYNPVRDYLDECLHLWDGKSRIRDLFQMFTLDIGAGQDPSFLLNLFEKWLITAVLLQCNKGTDAAQGVLVLVGAQGIGKTRLLYKLLPDPSWGTTGTMIDLRNKDTVMQALGYWIVELGEYGRNIKAEKLDNYKAFITNATDEFRAPYSRGSERHPRTTTFYASADTNTFLKDDAGERRNWTISIVGVEDVAVDMGQLWGEVAHLALVEKRPHWLNQQEIAQLNLQNELYKSRSSEYLIIYEALDWTAPWHDWVRMTAGELCKVLGMNDGRLRQIGKALAQMQPLGVVLDTDTARRKYTMPPPRDKWALAQMKQVVTDWELASGIKH